jgi:hypothetical protein
MPCALPANSPCMLGDWPRSMPSATVFERPGECAVPRSCARCMPRRLSTVRVPTIKSRALPSRCGNPCWREGLAIPDEHGLGIRTGAGGALVGRNGSESNCVFYVGPMLRADHWEATAVGELRVHAEQLARRLDSAGLISTNRARGHVDFQRRDHAVPPSSRLFLWDTAGVLVSRLPRDECFHVAWKFANAARAVLDIGSVQDAVVHRT